MAKKYIKIPYGKLKIGDCFCRTEEYAGIVFWLRGKVGRKNIIWEDSHRGNVSSLPDNYPVWIESPSFWSRFPNILLVFSLAMLVFYATIWFLRWLNQ